MFLHESPAALMGLSGQVVQIRSGMGGIRDTIAAMRALVNQYRTNMGMRECARQIAAAQPERDDCAIVNAIFCYVRDTVQYIRDINDVETLQFPDITLQIRTGDCDDQSLLLATLLEAVGYPTRFIVAAYTSNTPEHVYVQACVNGQWVDLDPIERTYEAGQVAPGARKTWIEGAGV